MKKALILCFLFAFFPLAQAKECIWIGTGSCDWQDAENWEDGITPDTSGNDSVIFTNQLPVVIRTDPNAFARSLHVGGEDVTMTGAVVHLTSGCIDVAQRAQLTIKSTLTGNQIQPFTKSGKGTLLCENQCLYFKGMEVQQGKLILASPWGDSIQCARP